AREADRRRAVAGEEEPVGVAVAGVEGVVVAVARDGLTGRDGAVGERVRVAAAVDGVRTKGAHFTFRRAGLVGECLARRRGDIQRARHGVARAAEGGHADVVRRAWGQRNLNSAEQAAVVVVAGDRVFHAARVIDRQHAVARRAAGVEGGEIVGRRLVL